ncbi:hypothetical protein R3P38DRAFT_2777022 [Favolaschia claudopus]|uniref:Uncharacterized protein n=1 Tax=Favolaschia claudopus TaxID=2862362 RepID=A0AAW0BMW8_9AGAR
MRQTQRPDASTSESTPAASNSSGETSRRLKPAQLASMARYRERYLQSHSRQEPIYTAGEARERMARRRARLAHDPGDQAQYREKARAADARYREGKAERLSTRQVDRRAMTYIQNTARSLGWGATSGERRLRTRSSVPPLLAPHHPKKYRNGNILYKGKRPRIDSLKARALDFPEGGHETHPSALSGVNFRHFFDELALESGGGVRRGGVGEGGVVDVGTVRFLAPIAGGDTGVIINRNGGSVVLEGGSVVLEVMVYLVGADRCEQLAHGRFHAFDGVVVGAEVVEFRAKTGESGVEAFERLSNPGVGFERILASARWHLAHRAPDVSVTYSRRFSRIVHVLALLIDAVVPVGRHGLLGGLGGFLEGSEAALTAGMWREKLYSFAGDLQRDAADLLARRPANPPQPGGRCLPYFYPEKGDESTFDVDHNPHKRYYVLGAGHCGGGIFTCPDRANRETNNFSGQKKRAVKTWSAAETVWREMHDKHHTSGCPEFTLPPDIPAPTPVYINGSIRTAAASLLPLVSPLAPSASIASLASLPRAASRAPPSPKLVRSRPPVTPQPGTQQPFLGSPFSPAVPSSVSPSPLRPPRVPASFPVLSPLTAQAPTPPPPTALYQSPVFSANTRAPPRTSSPLSRVSDILSDMSDVTSGFLSDMDFPSTTASPRSSPRTLSAIELDDDDEYAAEFPVDDELYAPRVMWAVKGLRYSSWDDPRDAIAAAEANGMGQMFTLMSSNDGAELENKFDFVYMKNSSKLT